MARLALDTTHTNLIIQLDEFLGAFEDCAWNGISARRQLRDQKCSQ